MKRHLIVGGALAASAVVLVTALVASSSPDNRGAILACEEGEIAWNVVYETASDWLGTAEEATPYDTPDDALRAYLDSTSIPGLRGAAFEGAPSRGDHRRLVHRRDGKVRAIADFVGGDHGWGLVSMDACVTGDRN